MEFLTLTDFSGQSYRAIPYRPQMSPAETEQADYLLADQEDLPLPADLPWPDDRLIVPEGWQGVFPRAALWISSAMSGGDLRQRFRELGNDCRCWLRIEPMAARFPLPCPDGQGSPVSGLPETEGFYSEALCCRYVHKPGEVILFDTEETLERKIALAKNAGFQGLLQFP